MLSGVPVLPITSVYMPLITFMGVRRWRPSILFIPFAITLKEGCTKFERFGYKSKPSKQEALFYLDVYQGCYWLFRVRFPALPDFLSSSGSGTGSTQPL
jgi:hypothetical protein